MPQIKLKATLQAYSRAPFYGDYVRQPKGLLGTDYDPNDIYVLKNGTWIDLTEAASEIGMSIDQLKLKIEEVERSLTTSIENISCYIDYDKHSLIFVNNDGQVFNYIIPDAETDGKTIGRNSENQLIQLDTADEKTITVTDVVYEKDPNTGFTKKASGKIRAQALYVSEDPTKTSGLSDEDLIDFKSNYISGFDIKNRLQNIEKNVSDLESYVQGTGGFLDPYNFSKSLLPLEEKDRNDILNNYAQEQLFGSADIDQQVPDQTKVKNIYTGNIWVFIQEKDTWVNEGQDTIVTATNDGVLGSVTGVEYDPSDSATKFKISIETIGGLSTGKMSVNGLQDEFDKVVYKDKNFSVDPIKGTYVERTNYPDYEYGTVKTGDSVKDDDAVNQGQFNSWQIAVTSLTTENIYEIVEEYFKPKANGGDI